MLNSLAPPPPPASTVYNEGLDRGWGLCLEVTCDNNTTFDHARPKLLPYNIQRMIPCYFNIFI